MGRVNIGRHGGQGKIAYCGRTVKYAGISGRMEVFGQHEDAVGGERGSESEGESM